MTNNLLCAYCLANQDQRTPEPAVTIVNGDATCIHHFPYVSATKTFKSLADQMRGPHADT